MYHHRTDEQRLAIYNRFVELRADKRLVHLPRVTIAERMGMKWTALEWILRWKNQNGKKK